MLLWEQTWSINSNSIPRFLQYQIKGRLLDLNIKSTTNACRKLIMPSTSRFKLPKTPSEILCKLLGNSCVSSITFKAYNCRHFIQKHLVNLGPKNKLQCYKTFFHQIVEYTYTHFEYTQFGTL